MLKSRCKTKLESIKRSVANVPDNIDGVWHFVCLKHKKYTFYLGCFWCSGKTIKHKILNTSYVE